MRRQAARLSVYYVLSLLSHSCLTNIETWPSVPLHSLSQDFYLSGDLILIKSDWIGRYFCGKVPGAHGAHILNASNCCARFDINQPFTRDHFICLEDHRCPTYTEFRTFPSRPTHEFLQHSARDDATKTQKYFYAILAPFPQSFQWSSLLAIIIIIYHYVAV